MVGALAVSMFTLAKEWSAAPLNGGPIAQPTDDDDSASSQGVQQKQSQVTIKTRLKIMSGRIATLLNGNIANELVKNLMEEYDALLMMVADRSEQEKAVKESHAYWLQYFTLKKTESTENRKSYAEPKVQLPKEKALEHDGKVDSFFGFLRKFEQRVAGASEESQLKVLSDAVHTSDSNVVALMGSLSEALSYLKEKYQSSFSLLGYFQKKLSKKLMSSHSTIADWQDFYECVTEAMLVAEQGDDLVRRDFINTVCRCLPYQLSIQLAVATREDWKKVAPFIKDHLYGVRTTDKAKGQQIRSKHKQPTENINGKRAERSLKCMKKVAANPGPRRCYGCQGFGHTRKECVAERICMKCGGRGHWAIHCRRGPAKPTAGRRRGIGAFGPRGDPRPRTTVKVEKMTMQGVVDTGAGATIVPQGVAPGIQAPVEKFLLADGQSELVARGPVPLQMEVAGTKVVHPTYLANIEEPVVGADLMKEYGGVVDMTTGELMLTRPPPQQLEVGDENTGRKDGEQQSRPVLSVTKGTEDEKEAPEEDQLKQEILEEFADLMQGVGLTDVVEHRIDTGDHRPIAIRGRRVPAHYSSAVSEHVEELLKEDVIEESSSDWQFPIVALRKKDGSLRMTIDLRQLNAITVKDQFPMPRVDEFFELVVQARIFSQLDLRKGYYQVPLKKEDRPKVAFAADRRLWQFKRMPFGACNAPATFQRMMTRILGELKFVFVYLDDVLIFSKNQIEHKQHVREVLERIRKAGLRLNAEKCNFGVSEVDFLGYRITEGKRTIKEDKAKVLKNYPAPETPKALKGFLGLAGFFRDLVPNFAVMAQPLYQAAKEKKLTWTNECSAAFEELKVALVNHPTTHLPDLNHPFIVGSDASDKGTGAVLMQDVEGQRRVVDFMSRTFNDTEKRYSTIEREATAILWALDKWHYYLLGRQFTIETDHKPLQWLLTKVDLPGKLGRLALHLQQYDIAGIEYVRGEDNVMADALSRIQIGLIRAKPSDTLETMMAREPNKFVKKDGKVYLLENGAERLCIDDENEKKAILAAVHDEAGHLGIYKCTEAVRLRFYWPHWKNDVKLHLKKCFTCQTKKDDLEPHKEEMIARESDEVFERVHLDLCGPLTDSDGYTYVAVLQDAYSKWIEAKPLDDTRAKTVIRWLQREVFSRFGEPKMLTTDGGTQFDSREFKEFCASRQIEHHITSPYHHQGNGLAERAIRTLETMMRTACKEQQEWSQKLVECVTTYNTRSHLTTGVTPYSLMFNRLPVTKLDKQYNLEPPPFDETVNKGVAKVNKTAELKRIKKQYDKKKKNPSSFSAGELVLWHVQEQGLGKSKKLNVKWKGPYRVVETCWPKVKLADRNGKEKTVHVNHLKAVETDRQLDIFRGRGRPRKLAGRSSGR